MSFAAVNVFFLRTLDDRCFVHGTMTAVYQKVDAAGERIAPDLSIEEEKSLTVDPNHVIKY